MPKKFVGENSKATVAKARKEAQKSEQREKDAREKEDRYWADDDKNAVKKQQRKVIFLRVVCSNNFSMPGTLGGAGKEETASCGEEKGEC